MFRITIFFILFSFYLQAQNTELDNRNGFKSLKFGTHMNDFKGLAVIPESKDSKVIKTIWKTDDSKLGYLFNDKIDFFELSFIRQTKELA